MNKTQTLPVEKQAGKAKRILVMLLGNLIIGFCVGLMRLTDLGVDPYSALVLGLSYLTHISFGTCMLLVSIFFFYFQWRYDKHSIGVGTIINLAAIGYIADFFVWLSKDVLHYQYDLFGKCMLLMIAIVFLTLGVAMFMDAKLGIAPYDDIVPIIQKRSKHPRSFRLLYTIQSILTVTAGVIFCLFAHQSIWRVVGIATVLTAFLTGPIIQFWSVHVVTKLLGENRQGGL